MRLLFVAADMHRGGAERHWATLIPALAGRGVDVRLLCLNDEGPLFGELRGAGVPAACAHLGGRADAGGLRRALAEAGGRPGAVVTRGVSPQLVGEAIALRAGAAHVLNEHTPLNPEGELLPMRPHQRLLTRLVAPRVDRVIAVSERQTAPLQRLGYRGERIVTVPNGLFEADVTVHADPTATRRDLRVIGGEFAVICVANLRPEKGVGAFVEAIWRAREQEPRLRGFVAGDGPQRAGPGAAGGGTRGSGAARLARRRSRPDRSLRRALPAERGRSAADQHPRGDGPGAAGGDHRRGRHGRGGRARRRPAWWCRPATRGAAAALARLAARTEWARELGEAGRARQRERFAGEAMVEGYEDALAEVATR